MIIDESLLLLLSPIIIEHCIIVIRWYLKGLLFIECTLSVYFF